VCNVNYHPWKLTEFPASELSRSSAFPSPNRMTPKSTPIYYDHSYLSIRFLYTMKLTHIASPHTLRNISISFTTMQSRYCGSCCGLPIFQIFIPPTMLQSVLLSRRCLLLRCSSCYECMLIIENCFLRNREQSV